jgi:EAL domain-containing protein (putative c-di-GMP-specific phosphodiesterase class I)
MKLSELDQLEVEFQPLVSFGTAKVIGFEALARWRHPSKGMVPPSRFIPLAEQNGLILELGARVLNLACAEASLWPADLFLAVNISPTQIMQPNVSNTVVSALRDNGLAPERLELEITESMPIELNPVSLSSLKSIRNSGVSLALDDFGMGYGSLSTLNSLPISKLKIDRSFIKSFARSKKCRAIVKALTGLADELCITTTAEGIETAVQFDALQNVGCTQGQGFLIGVPMPASAISDFLLNFNYPQPI